MDTYSINPASIIDEAVDLSMRLTGADFPISIFPTRIQRIISEVHECHNYPTDDIAAAILTAIAVGIGNTHLTQIKQGWIESPILYMALIGRPGANKSHPLSFAMKPFLDYDYQQNQVFEKALAKYDKLMSMSRKERTESGEEQFPQKPVMKLMGIENTQYIIARHIDREHPHCHIVFNRVNNDGKTISDKNDFCRNEKVCKMLTAKYRLYFANGKDHIKEERLRPYDKAKHEIYKALKEEFPKAHSWDDLKDALADRDIDMIQGQPDNTGNTRRQV